VFTVNNFKLWGSLHTKLLIKVWGWNRIQKGRHHSDLCTSTINGFLCNPLAYSFNSPAPWTKCSILLTEMSSKLPGFIKWRPRCLNLSVVKASQSQRTCEAVSDAYLHLLHSGLFTSPSINRCPFKWQCPVSNPVITLSWFLLRLSNSPAFLAECFYKKALSLLFSTYGLPMLLVFPTRPVPDQFLLLVTH
jgi:hypothetical protein